MDTKTGLVTIYDIIEDTHLLDNLYDISDIVLNVSIGKADELFNTRITHLMPKAMKHGFTAASGWLDYYAVSTYFAFLFYFVGCCICITCAYDYIALRNFEH